MQEISRVLKPGGALEIIEEDLYFPGSLRKSSVPQPGAYTSSLSPEPPVSDRPRAPTPLHSFYSQANNGSAVGSTGAIPQRPPMSPRSQTEPLLPLLSRSPTDYTETTTLAVLTDEPTSVRTSDQISRDSMHQAPVNPRDHSVLEYIYNEMHSARFINLEPLSLLGNTLSLYFKGVLYYILT